MAINLYLIIICSCIKYTYITHSYLCMPLQHPVTGPPAQVPDPDRLIPTRGQATVR